MAFNTNLPFRILKAIYLIPNTIKLVRAYRKAQILVINKKDKEALAKIEHIKNTKLQGKIGLEKSSIYYFLGKYQTAINLAEKMIIFFETTTKYNEYDKHYLLLEAKDIIFCSYREMNIKQPKLLNELSQLSLELDLSKVDKSLMQRFPMRHLKGWYKHNPKDEYYEETIAKYGEE